MINGAVLSFIMENTEEKSIILSAEQLQIIIDVLGIMPCNNENELKMWSDTKLQLMHNNGLKEIADVISSPKKETVITVNGKNFAHIVMGDYKKAIKKHFDIKVEDTSQK